MKKIIYYFKKNYIYYVIALIVFALDMLTKYLLTNKNIVLIKNVLSFKYSENTGAAFSMFSDSTILLIIVSVLMLVGIILYKTLAKPKKHILFTIAYPLIIGGALGNLFDRIFFGYVRDFVSLDFINFAIFNLADSALCVGFVILSVFLVFVEFNDSKNKQDTQIKQNENNTEN